MEIMIQILLLLPFALELPYDRYMLPQSEVTWKERLLIMTSCVAIVFLVDRGNPLSYYMLSVAPYCFFDPALSAWRFGWEEWHRLGETKYWDRFMANLQDIIGKWWLLFLRAVVCGLLIWLGL